VIKPGILKYIDHLPQRFYMWDIKFVRRYRGLSRTRRTNIAYKTNGRKECTWVLQGHQSLIIINIKIKFDVNLHIEQISASVSFWLRSDPDELIKFLLTKKGWSHICRNLNSKVSTFWKFRTKPARKYASNLVLDCCSSCLYSTPSYNKILASHR
jgi:hypothetical protein